MKRRSHFYIFLTVVLIVTLHIMSGYTTAGEQKEVPDIEKLYRYKCSLCHKLPDIDECGYTYEQWVNVMNAMHQPGRYSESVNAEDDVLLKDYLRTMSQK